MLKGRLQFLAIIMFLLVLVGSVVLAGMYVFKGVNIDLSFFNRTSKQYLGVDLQPLNYIYPQKKQPAVVAGQTPLTSASYSYQIYTIPGDYTLEKPGKNARSPYSPPRSGDIASLDLAAVGYKVSMGSSSEQVNTELSQYQFSTNPDKSGKLIFLCNRNCPVLSDVYIADVLTLQAKSKRYYYKVTHKGSFEQTDLAEVEATMQPDELLLLVVNGTNVSVIGARLI